jgi:hypothetical protein
MDNPSMTELYWVATNRNIDLEVRYAAARQMQGNRTPEKPTREIKQYSRDEEKIIFQTRGTVFVAERLGRTRCAIKNKRLRLKKKAGR